MPRLVAFDWDAREVRVVVATRSGSELLVQQAVRAPLPAEDPAQSAESRLAEGLRAALEEAGLGRVRALAAAPRPCVDLRPISVPPTPDNDLPELVRNQLVREIATLSDEAVVDYVAWSEQEDEPRTVMAAALPDEQLSMIRGACRLAGVRLDRLGLRPYAASALVRDRKHWSPQHTLIVDAVGDEADLTVVAEDHVVFSRTARLPEPEPEEGALPPLLAEIRRTVVAVSNQPGGGKVESVVFCGAAAEMKPWVDKLEKFSGELSLRGEVFDPFDAVPLRPALRRHLPSDRGRFAACLGLLWCQARQVPAGPNFLDPHQRREPFNVRKWLPVGGAAVLAALLLGLVGLSWITLAELEDQISRLRQASRALDNSVERAKEKQSSAEIIGTWAGSEVLWLDELRDFSARFPKRRDAVLSRLTLTRGAGDGGVVEFAGLVRDPSIVGKMERALRDEDHAVRSKRVQENVQQGSYSWEFESSVAVRRRSREAYLAAWVAQSPAAPSLGPRPVEHEHAAEPRGTPAVAREPGSDER